MTDRRDDDRSFEDHLNHVQALAKLVGLVGALAAQTPNATSVRELAGPLAFLGELLDDTVERAIRAELEDQAARCPRCAGEPAAVPAVRR